MFSTMHAKPLSKYPTASLREFLNIALPLALSLSSSYLLIVADRIFLSRYSLIAFEACAAAGGLYFFFQMLSLRFVSTVQAFIGEANGAKRYEEAGSYTWQMIWFSLISPLIVVPIGLLIGKSFFKGSPIEHEAMTYFTYMLAGNFLFSLEGTLSGFFSGIGDSKRVFKVHLISHTLNIALNIILIFGVPSLIPPLGIVGAALGTLIAKGTSCFILFKHFCFDRDLASYETKQYKLIPKRFFACINKALPRAIGQGVGILSWNYAARILITSGGIDLLTCSFGASLLIVLINDAAGITVLTVSTYLIGSGQLEYLPKLMRSVTIFLLINAVVIAIPFFIFPKTLIRIFCHTPLGSGDFEILIKTCYLVWLGLVCNSIFVISFMLITAIKDTWFYMFAHIVISPVIYPIIAHLHKQSYWTPTLFWIVVALHPLLAALIYFPRAFYKLNKLRNALSLRRELDNPIR